MFCFNDRADSYESARFAFALGMKSGMHAQEQKWNLETRLNFLYDFEFIESYKSLFLLILCA